MDWKSANLFGATTLSRMCGEYDVIAPKVPRGGRFKIKVFERPDGTFIAFLNVCLKDADGSPDGMAGLGRNEMEAFEKALKWFMEDLAQRASLTPDDFEWSDPSDF